MRSDDLTSAQVEAIQRQSQPMGRYLAKLRKRMIQRGFPLNDPLLLSVCQTESALQAIETHLHYITCGDVVMKQRQPPDKLR